MESRKVIYNAVLFCSAAALIYLLLFYALCRITISGIPLIYRTSEAYAWKGGNTYRKFIDYDRNAKYDVIVIGSSHAYRGYDPRIFKANGISLFNLGTNAQTPLNSYQLTRNYIRSGNCKLVLLEVYDASLASDGFESCADLVQNVSSDKAAFDIASAYTNPQIINMLLLRLINSGKAPMYADSFYVENGYSEKKDSIKKDLPRSQYESKIGPKPEQLDQLEKTLEYLEANGIRTAVVTHPFPKKKSRENHLKFHEAVGKICSRHQVEYFDFAFDHDFSVNDCFYDASHLNQNGVSQFNARLIRELKAKRIL
jgi:hypothetical protein